MLGLLLMMVNLEFWIPASLTDVEKVDRDQG